jgi:glucosyl-dolichyl phosphate glucuronosyltransferase
LESVQVKVTVILCTYNRSQTLARALESIAVCAMHEPLQWEVLVVDNNSRDDTRSIVEDFCRRYPGRFRYLFEPVPGKSYALNSGIRDTQSEILAFTDDDVTVAPNWLQNLTSPLNGGEWAGVAGRIIPANAFAVPRWLSLDGSYEMCGPLALFDRGDKPQELDLDPFGANVAYRRAMFDKYGGFRTDLGRCGDNLMSLEDMEFGSRVVSAGERLLYEPAAVVYHPVTAARLNKAYFLKFWFDLGRSSIRARAIKPDVWFVQRRHLTMLKTLFLLGPLRFLRWVFALSSPKRFHAKCWVWKTAGEVSELHAQRSTAVRPAEIAPN